MVPLPKMPKFLAPPPKLTGPAVTDTAALPMASNGSVEATPGSKAMPVAVNDR